MTINKIICAITALLLNNYDCQAAETFIESMGCAEAPLGTAWVKDLDPKMKSYHLAMANVELE